MDYKDNKIFDEVYKEYFGEKSEEISQIFDKPNKSNGIIKNEKLCAEGNISTVNQFGDILRKLLNVIWGTDWGTLEPDSSGGLDHNKVEEPRITYSTNLREVGENKSPKPTLTDVNKDEIEGLPTGEAFKMYRQTFDCIVEFNIRSTTSKGCSELAEKFEDAMILHAGFLKKKGVSEIFFLKEVPARYSNFFIESIPTKCLYFYVRLEKVRVVSISTLKQIEAQLDLIGENSDEQGMVISIQ